MQPPEARLSSGERRLLDAIFRGLTGELTFDWLATQRLVGFGYVEETPDGRLRLTAEGRRAAKNNGEIPGA